MKTYLVTEPDSTNPLASYANAGMCINLTERNCVRILNVVLCMTDVDAIPCWLSKNWGLFETANAVSLF